MFMLPALPQFVLLIAFPPHRVASPLRRNALLHTRVCGSPSSTLSESALWLAHCTSFTALPAPILTQDRQLYVPLQTGCFWVLNPYCKARRAPESALSVPFQPTLREFLEEAVTVHHRRSFQDDAVRLEARAPDIQVTVHRLDEDDRRDRVIGPYNYPPSTRLVVIARTVAQSWDIPDHPAYVILRYNNGPALNQEKTLQELGITGPSAVLVARHNDGRRGLRMLTPGTRDVLRMRMYTGAGSLGRGMAKGTRDTYRIDVGKVRPSTKARRVYRHPTKTNKYTTQGESVEPIIHTANILRAPRGGDPEAKLSRPQPRHPGSVIHNAKIASTETNCSLTLPTRQSTAPSGVYCLPQLKTAVQGTTNATLQIAAPLSGERHPQRRPRIHPARPSIDPGHATAQYGRREFSGQRVYLGQLCAWTGANDHLSMRADRGMVRARNIPFDRHTQMGWMAWASPSYRRPFTDSDWISTRTYSMSLRLSRPPLALRKSATVFQSEIQGTECKMDRRVPIHFTPRRYLRGIADAKGGDGIKFGFRGARGDAGLSGLHHGIVNGIIEAKRGTRNMGSQSAGLGTLWWPVDMLAQRPVCVSSVAGIGDPKR
ncbi:hypothetical protein DFP72DRAFT_855185 [Ephemerocybe angulata]|uniref:Uncharacterized protein n=1 Tax=Ephemerocybe angulata TaxID=980116 RepID=A0A8H6HIY0_9AGAR|nr:hypothetical protein DFP72DRAFT_855185 [Tulosesus angulatus]